MAPCSSSFILTDDQIFESITGEISMGKEASKSFGMNQLSSSALEILAKLFEILVLTLTYVFRIKLEVE